MLLRDRVLARLQDMGSARDYTRVAAEVLGIRNASPELARRLASQALVIEDRRETWRQVGQRISAAAPASPGVYVLKDADGRVLYVGKANHLRRRLQTHFSPRRWKAVKSKLARAADAEWIEVGSELEALLREAALIEDLAPIVNVQIGEPALERRAVPARLVCRVIVVLPSVETDSAELVCARPDGEWLIQRTRRNGSDLVVHAVRLTRFFHSPVRRPLEGRALAPLVFSWLAGRGRSATRLDPSDLVSPRDLRARLAALLADERLFAERIVVVDSKFPRP
jgi:predicted GIY-YIG superfamily endonuclease